MISPPSIPRTAQPRILTRVGVHHGLHHAAGLVHLQRPGNVAHRHPGDVDVAALLSGLPLAQPYPA